MHDVQSVSLREPSPMADDHRWAAGGLGCPRHMALDHMPARPCATASEPQATSGTRAAHTATRPSAIPATVTYARIGPLRLTRPRMTPARGWCCDLRYSPVEFSLSSSQPEDATARGIPTFPRDDKKKPRASRGLS